MRTSSLESPHTHGRWRRVGSAAVTVAALALAGLGTAAHASAVTPTVPTPVSTKTIAAAVARAHVQYTRQCGDTPKKGYAACHALRVTSGTTAFQEEQAAKKGVAPLTVKPNAASDSPTGYGPSDLQSAYGLASAASSSGSGRTIAIVDAYDDPNAESDLAAYRSNYGLSDCTSSNGCFTKVAQDGSANLPTADSGWAGEISLDLDMASAICPNCNITLVEANSSSMDDLGTAVNEAVSLGATSVSNSYGGSEDSTDTTYDSEYFNHPGVAITVSAGDSGYGAEYPATSQYVTAVGGTSLSTSSDSRGWSESVWNTSSTEGTGSGCSAYDPKPSWQTDTGCSNRMEADVSAVADPATGVSVYDTYGTSSSWNTYGGTSASSPIIAGVYALAGSPGSGDYPAQYPYGKAGTSALNDVTSGSNGTCDTDYFCTAGTGYDGPTGWGTPEGVSAFSAG
ncbi:peptidase S8 [Streptomyces sp. MUSC 14]|uniref:S53 family peptidase n=1 Tax=Streptomyces sp. MUSC 14 TaxID=1354889 RepID=UPI0008F58655|nr:S53 family peptidase [Streptomyces sp. MUSC 14]OIJ94699.1 peptidase S8 [Streptomyces sp. MUSC 14]